MRVERYDPNFPDARLRKIVGRCRDEDVPEGQAVDRASFMQASSKALLDAENMAELQTNQIKRTL